MTIALYDQNGNVLSSVNHHSATFSNLSHGRSYSIKFLESNGSASVEKPFILQYLNEKPFI